MNEYKYDEYKFFEEIEECYNSIIDEKSTNIFKNRLAFDMQPRFDTLLKMLGDDQLAKEYLEHLKPVKIKSKAKRYIYMVQVECAYTLNHL